MIRKSIASKTIFAVGSVVVVLLFIMAFIFHHYDTELVESIQKYNFNNTNKIFSEVLDKELKANKKRIKNIALATFSSTFNNNKSFAEALAEEIILASEGDNKSYAIKRKDEIERIAKASR